LADLIAGLPMYDRPELRDAHDRLWAAIRANLEFGPESLSSPTDMASFWQSDDLLFGQTCGMPYRTFLHDRVQLVGTPDYRLKECPPGYYRSAVIVHADSEIREFGDLAEKRIAYNEALSQSGWAAIIAEMEYADMRPSSGTHCHSQTSKPLGYAVSSTSQNRTILTSLPQVRLAIYLNTPNVHKVIPQTWLVYGCCCAEYPVLRFDQICNRESREPAYPCHSNY
jgi:hypothetical protein